MVYIDPYVQELKEFHKRNKKRGSFVKIVSISLFLHKIYSLDDLKLVMIFPYMCFTIIVFLVHVKCIISFSFFFSRGGGIFVHYRM